VTRRGLTLVALLFGATLAPAQPRPTTVVVRDESAPTARRLAEAAEKTAAGKPADAVADLQRILDTAGDDLVPASNDHLVPARWFVHRQFAALPADALRLYRDRIDEPARALLTKGKTERDPAPIRHLLARYFVSRATPEALSLLGELAFERGEYRRAERYWRQLLPADGDDLSYPDAPADPASVQARIVLARLFQGDAAGAKAMSETFRKNFPTAAGRLAGKTGTYADTLQSVLAHPPSAPVEPLAKTWPTFGSDFSRSGSAPATPVRLPVVPTWVTPVPKAFGNFGPNASPASIARSPAMHPVIAQGAVFLADAARVMRFDLKTGQPAVAFDLRKSDDLSLSRSVRADDLVLPPGFDADYALTAVGDRLYARLGTPAVRPVPGEAAETNPRSPASVIVRLGPSGKANDPALAVEWSAKPPRDGAAWEGAPVVTAGRVLAAFVRTEGDRVIHSVACYVGEGKGGPLWSRDVADAPAADNGSPPHRHELLTLAGDAVVYCTHSGAVVALDAVTGKPAWAVRYPRAKAPVQDYRYRGACPPVAAGGRVFVAPADAEAILALDAETGAPLWRAEGLRTHSLLGVTGSKLIVALAGPVRGVRAFDTATGADLTAGGWRNHDDPDLKTFGHGFVSTAAALWPTAGGLYPLSTADGYPAAPPAPGPQGNLAVADGVLVVATPLEVRGYVLDPAKPTAPAAAAPTLKVNRADPPAKGSFPVADEEPIPPPAPTKQSKKTPVPRVGGQSLIPLSVDPPLAVSRTGAVYRLNGDTPVPLGEIGFTPTTALAVPKVDSAVLTGPDGFARVRTTPPGGIVWAVSAPGYDLNSFQFAGTRIVCRAGEHHLIAFDLATGDNVWLLDGLNRTTYHPLPLPGAPRFDAEFLLTETHLVAHVSTGPCRVIDPRSGKVLRDDATAANVWPTPPVFLDPYAWTVPTGPGSVATIKTVGGTAWVFHAGREAGLSGELPQLRRLGENLLAAVRRNLGTDLNLLYLRGGPRWGDRPAFFPADRFDLRSVDADAANLYCPHDDRLTALRIEDGAEVWSVSLPASHGEAAWVAKAAAGGVIVYPTHAIPEEPVANVARRVGRSFLAWPTARRVAGLSLSLYEGWAARTVPVIVFDQATGKELRRFDLPALGPLALVAFKPGAGMTVVTGAKIYKLE
jgi:outer membrane protein assembly factor BamB